MAVVDDPRASVSAELDKPDREVELARVALLFAVEEYPDMDVDGYVARIGSIADAIRPRLGRDDGPASTIATINEHLYGELGFHGNVDDYYDPRNSYLNEVIDRRTGLP